MKKSEEIRRKTWRMIAKNLIVLVALAVAAFIGVRSWFTTGDNSKATGINMSCEIPDGLEIAIVEPGGSVPDMSSEDEWLRNSIVINADNYKFLEELFMCEVTGDGISFYSPSLQQSDGKAYVVYDSETPMEIAVANGDYVSFDMYMRSKNPNEVILTENSAIRPVAALVSGTSYSADSVVGAVRFSVLDSGNNRELLWIPAPNVYYDADYQGNSVNDDKGYVYSNLDSNDSTKSAIYYNPNTDAFVKGTEGTYNHAYYTSEGVRTILSSFGDNAPVTANNACDYTLGINKTIASLSQQSGEYYYNKVRCNLWIEGEDAESRLAMVNGRFALNLKLELD